MPRNCSHGLYVVAAWLTIGFPLWLMAGHVACDIALSSIAVLFLLRSALEKDWRWCTEPWVKGLALLWLYIILRGLFAEDPLLALHRALPFVRYFVFAAALAYWLLQDSTTQRRFYMALTYVLLFLALDGLLQWFARIDLVRQPIFFDLAGHFRLTGPFRKPMLGIMMAWLYFPVCLKFVVGEAGASPPKNKLLAGILGALLVLAVIVLSGERMALLLTLFGWVLAILLLPAHRPILSIMLIASLLLTGAIAFLSPQVLGRQVDSTANTLKHWQGSPYGQLFSSDVQLAKQHSVFGVGAGHFGRACEALYTGRLAPDSQSCNTHPHNIYMEWLIENGAVGLVLFMAFLVAVLRICFTSWPNTRLNPVFIGLLIAFILRIWPIASSTNFFSAWGAPPFWLVLGALLAYTEVKETSDADTAVTI